MRETALWRWFEDRPRWFAVAAVAGVVLVIGGGGAVAATAIASNAPTAQPTASPSASGTPTPTASASVGASAESSPTSAPSPSATPSATASAQPETAIWAPDFPLPDFNGASQAVVASFAASDGGFQQPVFTLNGGAVAVVYGGMDRTRVYVGATDGSALVSLPKVDEVYDSWNVAWSPDGTRVAFLSATGSGGTAVATAKSDGTGVSVIATLPAPIESRSPVHGARLSWSGDGSTIAVTLGPLSGELADSRVVLVDVTSRATSIIEGAGAAAFAPSGSALAYFGADASGKPELWLREASGSAKQLAVVGGETWAPWTGDKILWSPDGSRIAYAEFVNNDWAVRWHVTTSAGAGAKALGTLAVGGAAWSPDSRRLAFLDEDTDVVAICDASAGGCEPFFSGARVRLAGWGRDDVFLVVDGRSVYAGDVTSLDGAYAGPLDADWAAYGVAPGGQVGVVAVADLARGTATVALVTK